MSYYYYQVKSLEVKSAKAGIWSKQSDTCSNGHNEFGDCGKMKKGSTKNRVIWEDKCRGLFENRERERDSKEGFGICWVCERGEEMRRGERKQHTLNAYQLPGKRPAICRTVTAFVTGQTGYSLARLGSATWAEVDELYCRLVGGWRTVSHLLRDLVGSFKIFEPSDLIEQFFTKGWKNN